MALGKKPTTRIMITVTLDLLTDLAGWSHHESCSISEVIRRQLLAMGPPPPEGDAPSRNVSQRNATSPAPRIGPKVDPDFNFGA